MKFVKNFPALLIPKERILVIADLHLGLEHEYYELGITIPPQAEKFANLVNKLVKQSKSKILIILGDLKHEVPGISLREERQIPKFFSKLKKDLKVILVRGNHDTFIERIIPANVKVMPARGFKIGKYGFFHGHAWPSKELMDCNTLFMAHIHPVIEFKDRFGYRLVEQVWVDGRLNKEKIAKRYKLKKVGRLRTIIMPAFNKLLGGVALNKMEREELMGPLLLNNVFELNSSKVYTLDGTFLGTLKDLKL